MNGDKQIRRYTDENSYLKMKCIFNFYISFAVSVCLLVCFKINISIYNMVKNGAVSLG